MQSFRDKYQECEEDVQKTITEWLEIAAEQNDDTLYNLAIMTALTTAIAFAATNIGPDGEEKFTEWVDKEIKDTFESVSELRPSGSDRLH